MNENDYGRHRRLLNSGRLAEYSKFVDRLRYVRKTRGLSQQQVAEMAGLSQASYSRIEDGTIPPRIEALMAIARALAVPMPELLPALRNKTRDNNEISLPFSLANRIKAAARKNDRTLQEEAISALKEKYPVPKLDAVAIQNLVEQVSSARNREERISLINDANEAAKRDNADETFSLRDGKLVISLTAYDATEDRLTSNDED